PAHQRYDGGTLTSSIQHLGRPGAERRGRAGHIRGRIVISVDSSERAQLAISGGDSSLRVSARPAPPKAGPSVLRVGPGCRGRPATRRAGSVGSLWGGRAPTERKDQVTA